MEQQSFDFKKILQITLLTSVWIHVSEVFRYFLFVMPEIQAYFNHQPGVADMDWSIFAIWGAWDTLLTGVLVFVYFLFSNAFGSSNRSVLVSGTTVWLAIFVIFWVATANMGLSDWSLLWITLPLSWLEMIIGTWMASKLYKKYRYEFI